MRVTVYAENDRVTYNAAGKEYRAVIVGVHNVSDIAFSGGYEYTIRITSNGLAYRSGDTFRTTAAFLTGKPKPKTRKPVSAKKRAERKNVAKLKEMHKQLMR